MVGIKLIPRLSKEKYSFCPIFLSLKGQDTRSSLKDFPCNCRYRIGGFVNLSKPLYLHFVLTEGHFVDFCGQPAISVLRSEAHLSDAGISFE